MLAPNQPPLVPCTIRVGGSPRARCCVDDYLQGHRAPAALEVRAAEEKGTGNGSRVGAGRGGGNPNQELTLEVPLQGSPASVVLADQVKSFDWRSRKAVRKGKASASELAEVRAKIGALIGLP